jgi:hypothetical protein
MTTHEFARSLLALPDLPVFHFDPSLAGLDEEIDHSLTEPVAEVCRPDRWDKRWKPFVTISSVEDRTEEADGIDAMRDDRQRLDWVLAILATRGTDGLRDIIPWEPPCPPDRDSLDIAMGRCPTP